MARDLTKRYHEKFTTDFETNKRTLDSMATIYSSKLRNLIAGYITRLMVISKTAETGETAEESAEETEDTD
jgi:small subunit ribosomal protein S17e